MEIAGNRLARDVGAFALSCVKTLLMLVFGIIVLRFAILELGSSEPISSDMTSLGAILDGRIFEYVGMSWDTHISHLFHTSEIVLLALLWSTLISLVLGYQLAKRPHARLWNMAAGLFTVTSGFPLFAIGLLAYRLFYVTFPQDSLDSSIDMHLRIAAAALILGSCEGALGEWPRNFRAIFSDLQERTYYQACRGRGQSTFGIAYRTAKPFLYQSLATRITYLFGAVIIVEQAVDIPGEGYNLIYSIVESGSRFAYNEAMISGLLIMAVPITIRMLLALRLRSLSHSVVQPNQAN